MLEHLIALLAEPERHACVWRNGELYVVASQELKGVTTSRDGDDEKIAA